MKKTINAIIALLALVMCSSFALGSYDINVEAQFINSTGWPYTGTHNFEFNAYNSSDDNIFSDSFAYTLDDNGRLFKTFSISYDFVDAPPKITWKIDSEATTVKVQTGFVTNAVNAELLNGHDSSYFALVTEPKATSLGNWTADKSDYLIWVDTKAYIDSFGNWSDDKSNYSTTAAADLLYAPISEPIAASLGNWSADKSSYTATADLVSIIGNWSADKVDYSTTAAADLLYAPIAEPIAASLGNWSADKSGYTTTAGLVNASVNSSNYWDALNTPGDITSLGILTGLTINGDSNTTGIVYFKDESGQVRRLNNVATHISEMQSDTLLDASRSSLSCTGGVLNFTLYATSGAGQFNFNGTIYPKNYTTVSNQTITLSCGTDVLPKNNYIYWELVADVPTMKTSESYPTTNHIDVGTFIVGDCSGSAYTVYSYERNRYEVDSFVKRSLERWEDTGTLYVSGFTPNATKTNVTVAAGGEFFSNILEITSANNMSLTEGYYYINASGNFIQANSLVNLTMYSDGTAFSGVNERVNVVWGVVPTSPNSAGTVPVTMRLVAILPSYPGAGNTYQSIANANSDIFETTTYYPSDSNVKMVFTPIARTILRPNSDVLEAFPNGKYYQDVRGRVTSGGSAPSPGITNHADLTNLDYASSGHTGFATAASVTSIGNWSADKPSYTTTSDLVTILGNWSADKPSYTATSDLVSILGNWSADKSSYYTSAIVDTLGNWSNDKNGYLALSGGTMSGNLNMSSKNITVSGSVISGNATCGVWSGSTASIIIC